MKLELAKLEIRNEPVARNIWRTAEDYMFFVDDMPYMIPSPFYHDKYSVVLSNVGFRRSRKTDAENLPAVLHDYLVRYRKVLGFSIVDCHELFKQAMGICGLPMFTILCKYSAVMMFNWLMAGPGDGTPPRKVRRAMRRSAK